MKTTSYLQSQYTLVRQARKVLFDYCNTISTKDFLNTNNSFGRGGSIRNLLVHIANTYEFWIVGHALKKEMTYTKYTTVNSMDGIRELFDSIDNEMDTFITKFELSVYKELELEINGKVQQACALELFTHVITHEFHHKGQVLSLSRHLGYVPIDTDVIR